MLLGTHGIRKGAACFRFMLPLGPVIPGTRGSSPRPLPSEEQSSCPSGLTYQQVAIENRPSNSGQAPTSAPDQKHLPPTGPRNRRPASCPERVGGRPPPRSARRQLSERLVVGGGWRDCCGSRGTGRGRRCRGGRHGRHEHFAGGRSAKGCGCRRSLVRSPLSTATQSQQQPRREKRSQLHRKKWYNGRRMAL